jgi:hypothetical protein
MPVSIIRIGLDACDHVYDFHECMLVHKLYTYICICVCVYKYIYICINTCMYVCMNACLCINYIDIYIYIHIIYIYVYIYIYIYICGDVTTSMLFIDVCLCIHDIHVHMCTSYECLPYQVASSRHNVHTYAYTNKYECIRPNRQNYVSPAASLWRQTDCCFPVRVSAIWSRPLRIYGCQTTCLLRNNCVCSGQTDCCSDTPFSAIWSPFLSAHEWLSRNHI